MAANKKTALEAPAESVYDRSELIEHAREVFNVQPEVVVGALHGNEKQTLTISEVKEAVDKFLKGKVK